MKGLDRYLEFASQNILNHRTQFESDVLPALQLPLMSDIRDTDEQYTPTITTYIYPLHMHTIDTVPVPAIITVLPRLRTLVIRLS